MIEDCKMDIDKEQITGLIFSNPSKAFDTISHCLPLDRLDNSHSVEYHKVSLFDTIYL